MPNTIEPRRLSFSFSKGKKTATPSMQSFQTVFLAEHIKIKRKGIYLISIILSALVPVLYFGYCLKKPETLASPLPFGFCLLVLTSVLSVLNYSPLVRKHLEPFCALNSKLKRHPFPFNRLK